MSFSELIVIEEIPSIVFVIFKKKNAYVKTLTFLDQNPHSDCLLHHAKVMQNIHKNIFFPLNHPIIGITKPWPCHNASLYSIVFFPLPNRRNVRKHQTSSTGFILKWIFLWLSTVNHRCALPYMSAFTRSFLHYMWATLQITVQKRFSFLFTTTCLSWEQI